MQFSNLAAICLAAIAAGSIAYVFIYPFLSGDARAEKRQKMLLAPANGRRIDRVPSGANRRDQVAQSLKEIEDKKKSQKSIPLEARIAQAGLEISKSSFIGMSLVAGLVCGLLSYLMSSNPYLALGVAFVFGFGLPRWVLGYLKKKRMNKFVTELPNAMDVIVRGIRSGLPLGDCLRIIAAEAQEPVKSEFKTIVEAQTLGISVSDAVAKLYDRVPVPETNFFGIVIAIQQKAGGNLSEALSNLSKVLRERKRMKGKITAMSVEAKSSAAIIASLPLIVAVIIYIANYKYIELLWITEAGQVALFGSAMWMMMGVLVMRKMINFDF